MVKASREFQVFAKPVGPACNLGCQYCYYLKKEHLYPAGESFHMPDSILEEYIVQHIQASPEPVIRFSWHGGEPTILGLDYFRKIVALQRKHLPRNRRIVNGIQNIANLLFTFIQRTLCLLALCNVAVNTKHRYDLSVFILVGIRPQKNIEDSAVAGVHFYFACPLPTGKNRFKHLPADIFVNIQGLRRVFSQKPT